MTEDAVPRGPSKYRGVIWDAYAAGSGKWVAWHMEEPSKRVSIALFNEAFLTNDPDYL